jgi:branched-chain amino acid aminotransferase
MPPYGSRDPRECVNKFFAFAVPFIWIADPEKQKVGIHATISHVQRIQPESVDPTVKNYHWLDLIAGLFSAYESDGETTILVDGENNIVEGPGFNVFIVKDGTLVTPDQGVLEGVTRKVVIELAERLGVPVNKRQVSADEVREVDEMFGTSTAGGIIPLTKINGKSVGDGCPGYVTQRLHQEYWNLHDNHCSTSPVGYYQ